MPDINTNKITLVVNGEEYSQFSEISVKRSIEAIASTFEFVASNEFSIDFPFKAFDNCVVKVNDIDVVTGFITFLNPKYSNSEHFINIIGYDKTKNVVDTELFNNSQFTEATKFKEIIETILSSHGITNIDVIDNSGGLEIGEDLLYVSSETGTSLYEYFLSLASKEPVLLNTDGKGNIVIYRNVVPTETNLSLINKRDKSNDKIKSAECIFDYNNRYKTIKVRSQYDDDSNIKGEATDNEIKQERTKTIISDLVYTVDKCNSYADWEVNRRRADSIQYKCTVAGFWAKDNVIFEPNQFFGIDDDYCGINDTMLLKELEYRYSETSGSITNLTFVTKNAYTLESNPLKQGDI